MRQMWMWAALALAACGGGGAAGDPCESEDDCDEGLHCHIEDGEGVCESDDEHDKDTAHDDHGDE